MRSLAHIEKVEWIKPIDGADRIELIGVLGWVCVAKKGEFNVGDIAVYIEIDSKCPETDERFSFLESKNYKVKTMKLGKFNVISQGLAMTISLFPELKDKQIGDDVTKELKITHSHKIKSRSNPNSKYTSMISSHKKLFKNPIIKKLMKYKMAREFLYLLFGKKNNNIKAFPEWIVNTDETRIENVPFYLELKQKWIKSEKVDGTSCTYAVKKTRRDYEFIVCSRNVRQIDKNQKCYHESNIYWELADKYNIKEVLTKFAKENNCETVVLQGEGVGFVQGNPYKLNENRLYCFNLVINGVRTGSLEMADFCNKNNLQHVPIIATEYEIPYTMEEMKLEADGNSVINPDVPREGFVYRSTDGKLSFKNVSRQYLLLDRVEDMEKDGEDDNE